MIEHEAGAPHGRRVRADEHESILGSERDRRESRVRERFVTWNASTADERVAFADQHERDVRERRQIADADRSPRGNRGEDFPIQRIDERAENRNGHTRAALRHPRNTCEHDRAHAILGHQRTDADGTRAHRVHLVARALVGSQRLARIRAKRRGQPVDRLIGVRGGIDDRACPLEPLDDRRRDADRRTAGHRDHIGDADAADAGENGIRVDFRACSRYVWQGALRRNPKRAGALSRRRIDSRRGGYFTTPFDLRKSRATSFGSIFSPSTL